MQRMFNDIRHKKVKNMTQTQKVLEFMKGKEKVHYKDVVIGTELKSGTVRGILKMNCPFCKKDRNDMTFKDQLSLKEHSISGLCQECQDQMFGRNL